MVENSDKDRRAGSIKTLAALCRRLHALAGCDFASSRTAAMGDGLGIAPLLSECSHARRDEFSRLRGLASFLGLKPAITELVAGNEEVLYLGDQMRP